MRSAHPRTRTPMRRPRDSDVDLLIGTSGWTYDSWEGPFYPPELSRTDWLAWYGTQFATAEINGSFYRTPSLEAVGEWRKRTPSNFVFAWKASKFITHWKRLKETCSNSIALMGRVCRCSDPNSGRSCSNCRRASRLMVIAWRASARCCRRGGAMPSNAATHPGTTTAFSICLPRMMSRCASQIIIRHRHRGSQLPVTYMCAVMVPTGAIAATIPMQLCANGAGA